MRKLIQIAVVACATGLGACDLPDHKVSVPESVQQQFAKLYPTVNKVEWDDEDGLYEAEFEISGRERVAQFSPAGQLVTYSEEIEEQYLPHIALEELNTNFAAYKVAEATRVNQQNKTVYQVELKQKHQQDVTLVFDADGYMLQPEPYEAGFVSKQGKSADPESLGKPSRQWELPEELREVSGIALVRENLMACVQDEEGAIYLFDLEKSTVVQKIPFAGPGDYEGIALVSDTAYVLRSDGALFEVPDFTTGKQKAVYYPSELPATLDTEGLTYDRANKRLLIGYKGEDKKLTEDKGIYAFSLSTKKMLQTPVITIPLKQPVLQRSGQQPKTISDLLQASSLELHPGTGALFVLDSPNKRLLRISEKGEVLHLLNLDKELLRQPEGLAFGNQGEFYIASEGSKKGKGVLLKFETPLL
ncbi:hypothetical protein FVR03_08145 [Pontibacter qinzhouensis]|uniref:Lipoprotein n=1 Tax=Pontibacter qinzhouensis TaxID=2603253 RepID=A0A5C8KAM8_9BACT|nr:SdiA-regulated domain-containing protein [Pontibacter qinzhouensis]TXK48135.1 hypothetical protein FVR03_08145 [Pontibacter qinzhouensis]